MPTKQWLQVEVGNENVMYFRFEFSVFHIQPRFQAVRARYSKFWKCLFKPELALKTSKGGQKRWLLTFHSIVYVHPPPTYSFHASASFIDRL